MIADENVTFHLPAMRWGVVGGRVGRRGRYDVTSVRAYPNSKYLIYT